MRRYLNKMSHIFLNALSLSQDKELQSVEFRKHFASDDRSQYQTQSGFAVSLCFLAVCWMHVGIFESLPPRVHPLVQVGTGQRDRPEHPESRLCGRELLGRVLRARRGMGFCPARDSLPRAVLHCTNKSVAVFVQGTVALIILR